MAEITMARPAEAVGEHADMAVVRAAHMLGGRDHAFLDHMHEGARGISLGKRLPQIAGGRLAGKLDIAGAKLAPAHRHEMRREVHRDGCAGGDAQLLLDLRHVAVIADAVGREPLACLREQDVLLERAASA